MKFESGNFSKEQKNNYCNKTIQQEINNPNLLQSANQSLSFSTGFKVKAITQTNAQTQEQQAQ